MVPWHEFDEEGDFVVGEPGKNIGEPSSGIDAVEPGDFDQGMCDDDRLSAAFRAHEEVFRTPKGVSTHFRLGSTSAVVHEWRGRRLSDPGAAVVACGIDRPGFGNPSRLHPFSETKTALRKIAVAP